jgi:hypothetical protein
MTRALKEKCERIAREAGAVLTWIEGDYGYYIPGTNKIFVGGTGSKRAVATIFCHELGHYKNYLSGKYYRYHHLKGKTFSRKFKTKDAIVRYALKAEIYTDKVGKRLCAQYFPEVKYKKTYKFNKAFYDSMYQKYFGSYIIILIPDENSNVIIDTFYVENFII